MFFWFKKKEIVLDCFTYDNFAYEYCKIDNSMNYLPKWYVNLPGSLNLISKVDNIIKAREIPTIKHCVAFSELYKKSFTIPFWDTLIISYSTIEGGYKWEFKGNVNSTNMHRSGVTEHSNIQMNKFRSNLIGHFKIGSPWAFKTKEFVQFTWHEPVWNNNNFNRYNILPAVIDFKYQHNTEINFIFEYNKEKDNTTEIIFTPNDPLVMLTPLSNENILIKTHLISEREFFNNYTNFRQETAANQPMRALYKMKKKFKDNFYKREDAKEICPFGRK